MAELAQAPLLLPFTRGIDTKSDTNLVAPPFLRVLENGVFAKGSSISKRNGFSELGTNTNLGANITTGAALAAFGPPGGAQELLLFDDQRLYSYSQANAEWVARSPANTASTSSATVVRNGWQQTQADWAVNGKLAVYAWQDSRGGVRASVVDLQTGVYYQSDVSLNPSASSPRVIAVGNSVVVAYGDGTGNLRISRLGIAAPSAFETDKILISDANVNGVFAWAVFGGAIVIAYANNGNTTTLAYITPNGFLGVPQNGYYTPTTLAAAGPLRLALVTDGASLFCAQWASNVLYCTQAAANLTVGTSQSVRTVFGVNNVAGAYDGSGTVFFVYDWTASAVTNVSYFTVNTVNTVLSRPTIFLAGFGLGAQPFVYQGQAYVVLIYASALQTTYFVVGVTNGLVISRHLYGLAGGLLPGPALPQVLSPTNGAFAWPALKKGKLNSQNGATFTLSGVALQGVNFAGPGRYASAPLGDQLLITGGVVQSYDSANLTEHGFLLAPEGLAVASIAATGGSLTDGTYVYQVIWEWVDNKGQLHKSAPSAPLTVTLSGGTGTQLVALNIPTLRLTAKSGVTVGVYRTTANGSVYFKTSSVASPIRNDPTVASISFADLTSDAALQGNEILYTVGGELPNDPPPAATLITAGKGRLWLAGTEDPDLIYYSKQKVTGIGASFSLALTKRIPSTGGPPTALAVMDDKVIVFKQLGLYFFSGDGPNAIGANDSFTAAQMIAADVGCSNPASVVVSSEGVYFASAKGLYLLTRSLQLQYVGAPVESYAQTITSAVLLQNANQLRFGAQGPCLVCNYFFQAPFSEQVSSGQWSTFTNYESAGATNWQGAYTFLRANGVVRVENTGYLDGTVPIKLKLRTAWVKPEVLGFSRIYEAAVLGTYYSPHQLVVNIAYDYRPFDSQQLVFDTRTGIPLDTWGADATLGQQSTWGGFGDSSYQFRSRIPTQQCSAIQFEFSDNIPAGVAAGQSFSINALSLLVGVNAGLARLPASKTI